ncbi:MAG: xanthine dehydrogenase small subunit [Deltaproteobacteria bacterium]|nr:xanthine dehydrogenase small subunit [Deltaproteobacteria bacterium]
MEKLTFYLNDRRVEIDDLPPTTTLLGYLREHAGLPGTKEGCAEGDCGACSVALLDPEMSGGPGYRTVCSCLLLLPMVHGRRIYTVEGLAGADGGLHPAQAAIRDGAGSQCGYCTPGFALSLFEATYREDLDSDARRDDQLSGNLCRCTGYRPLHEALARVAGSRPDDRFRERLSEEAEAAAAFSYRAGENQRFFRPVDYDGLYDALDTNPDARIVCGGTDLGLEVTKGGKHHPCLVSVEAIPPFRRIVPIEGGHRIGSTVPLADVEVFAREALPTLARMLRFFGSRQIKHRGTLGGNVCNASPVGDTPPVLLALDATMIARSRHGERRIPAAEFWPAYRTTALQRGEVLAAVEIPRPSPRSLRAAYKVSKRRQLDIATVSACFFVDLDPEERVTEVRLAFGGMAATPARAPRAEGLLRGEPWSYERVAAAAAALDEDFTPIDDVRGSAWYRRTVARNLLLGFFDETRETKVPRLPDRPTATVQVK